MEKDLLIRFVAGETNETESLKVLDWADAKKTNKDYLISLQLIYMALEKNDTKATEKELNEINDIIKAKIKKENSIGITQHLENSNKTQMERKMATDSGNNAEKSKNAGTLRFYKALAIGASIAAVLITVFFSVGIYFNKTKNIEILRGQVREEMLNEEIRVALSDMPSEIVHSIYTERGVKSEIMLPDSSIVILNSDTKLTFPDKFVGSTREVLLNGEAYFKVHKDAKHPMIVNTNKNFKIKVTGTEFNIKSYDEDEESVTTLYSGSINLLTSNGEKKIIPNQPTSVDSKNRIKVVERQSSKDTKAWTEGKMIFDGTGMDEVIKILERWHGVTIIVKDPQIYKYKITANFNSESMPQIMYIIKNCALIDYVIDEKKVILFARNK